MDGWILKEKRGYKRELVARLEGKLKESHSAELRRERAEAWADRIIAEELKGLGWKRSELAARRKNDPDKLTLTARLRKKTILTVKEIASRICLGTSKGAKSNLHKWVNQKKASEKQSERPKL